MPPELKKYGSKYEELFYAAQRENLDLMEQLQYKMAMDDIEITNYNIEQRVKEGELKGIKKGEGYWIIGGGYE